MDNNTASDAVASDAVSTVEQPATKKAKVDSGIPERKSANSETETASDAVTAAETIASAAIAHAGEAGQSASEDKKRAEESSEFEVINWEDALEQCSADEEFLRELLGDLRDEVLENTNKIQSAVGAQDEGYADECRRAAHAVKGAAANLMCHEINHAAMMLETRAKEATTSSNASDATDLKVLAEVLADALKNFEIFLKSKGI